MSFFYICDTDLALETSKPLALKVLSSNGFNVTPQIDIVTTNLKSSKKNFKYKNFFNSGYGGIVFKIDIIVGKDEETNKSFSNTEYDIYESDVLNWLHYWYVNMLPVYVVTDAIDVPNGQYIITDNDTRKQTYKKHTIWSLEFTTYNPLNTVKWTAKNSAIEKVIKKYNDSKKKTTTKTTTKTSTKASSKSTVKSKLSKCKLSNLKYTGKKVTNITCVKYLQEILYKAGYLTKKQIDGWYGDKTLNAVKKWQKKYKTKYKLKVTGKMDSATLKAMCK